jgi:maleate isomerase
LERDYLESYGLNVSVLKGLGLHDPMDICEVGERVITSLVDEIVQESDVIYISFTNLPAVKLISKIERKGDFPVVTSNQAALYVVLKEFKIQLNRKFGRLFTSKEEF